MESEEIKKEMKVFELAVKKLSHSVGKASSLWKDEAFSALYASVSDIANYSKDVITTGDRCCALIDKFNKIAAEK